MRIDAHQHVWTEPFLEALARRGAPPRLHRVAGQALLETAEGPYAIDRPGESSERRRALVDIDGLDLALVALSSPIGVEALPRTEATALIESHLAGVAAMGPRFAAWGPIPLDGAGPEDVDEVLDAGCVGVSLPAGAVVNRSRLGELGPVLERISERRVPLFVHPGPGLGDSRAEPALESPQWWIPMTSYVSQMQAAWLTFATSRSEHPQLEVVFAMLAGGAPLLVERLAARGGPAIDLRDPRIFYDGSSFGALAIEAVARVTGFDQLVYGSDRPVVEPTPNWWTVRLQENAARLVTTAGAAL